MSISSDDARNNQNLAQPGARKSALLTSAGFAHAFFTRKGGTSSGAFASLNFSTVHGDDAQAVDRNLAVAAAILGTEKSRIFYLSQVHGTRFLEIEVNSRQQELLHEQGDIVLTRTSGQAAAVRTADCVPILFGCRASGWVAACHAGWRGCAAGAVLATVRALKDRGAADLVCAIGPHISVRAFEVSEEVARELQAASPDKNIIERGYEKPHVDLRKMVRAQLRSVGLSDSLIDDVEGCTYQEPEWFFSYRRDGNPSGRMLSAIVAP